MFPPTSLSCSLFSASFFSVQPMISSPFSHLDVRETRNFPYSWPLSLSLFTRCSFFFIFIFSLYYFAVVVGVYLACWGQSILGGHWGGVCGRRAGHLRIFRLWWTLLHGKTPDRNNLKCFDYEKVEEEEGHTIKLVISTTCCGMRVNTEWIV